MCHSDVVRGFLLVEAASTAASSVLLLKFEIVVFFGFGTVVRLVKDWVVLRSLELGLEIGQGMTVSRAVGTTTRCRKGMVAIVGFDTGFTPTNKLMVSTTVQRYSRSLDQVGLGSTPGL